MLISWEEVLGQGAASQGRARLAGVWRLVHVFLEGNGQVGSLRSLDWRPKCDPKSKTRSRLPQESCSLCELHC